MEEKWQIITMAEFISTHCKSCTMFDPGQESCRVIECVLEDDLDNLKYKPRSLGKDNTIQNTDENLSDLKEPLHIKRQIVINAIIALFESLNDNEDLKYLTNDEFKEIINDFLSTVHNLSL